MMDKSGPTKRPWKVGYSDGSGATADGKTGACIVGPTDRPVVYGADFDGCATGVLKQADADFIVHAVNLHDDLLAACSKALDVLRWMEPNDTKTWPGKKAVKALRQVIAKAEGRS